MSDLIHIFGHKNPDTDSICSSLAYAHLKRVLGENAQAFRLGDVNFETNFILNKYKMDPPELLEDGRSRLSEIEIDEALVVEEHITIRAALRKMKSTRNKAIYISDENGLKGVATLSDITNTQVQDHKQLRGLLSLTPIENIVEVLEGTIIHHASEYRCNGRVYIAALSVERLESFDFNNSIIVVGDNQDNQMRAIEKQAGLLIISSNSYVADEVIAKAKQHGCSIVTTHLDTFNIARFIYQAPTISLIMSRKLISFHKDTYVDDVSRSIMHYRYRSYPVVDDNNHVVGAVSRYHLFSYQKRKVILLDHNERSQSIDNIDQTEILEIIDHHRIGDIQTSYPINFRNRQVGSSATIIAGLYREYGVEVPYNIACLLINAVISDTLNFNSPTCTEEDVRTAKALASLHQLNLTEIANDLFIATSSLKNKDAQQIIFNDFKEYKVNGKRLAIGQINIIEQLELQQREQELREYVDSLIKLNGYDCLLMVFTDVQNNGSYFIYDGKLKQAVEKAFPAEDYSLDTFYPGIISRKNQLGPRLFAVL
ncbi:MAG: putative manganese-dependent inorganic diphosphatase [Erysipelotrichaceae bacterium]